MKKVYSVIMGVLLIFSLAACNSTAKPVNDSSKGQSADKPKTSELTLAQVMKKTTKAAEGLKSFSVKMDMDQEISTDKDPKATNIKSSIEMDMTTNPQALYQKMKMTMPDLPQPMNTESYFTKDGMYMFESTSKKWMKMPKEMSDQIMQMTEQQNNPMNQLKELEKFVNDFKFEQDNNNYILTLNATGDKFADFVKKSVSLPQGMEQMQEVLKGMKINKLEYKIFVDKKTFYPTSLDMKMDMEMTAEGQTVKMKQAVNGAYSNFNAVDPITVPKEAIDTAEEIKM